MADEGCLLGGAGGVCEAPLTGAAAFESLFAPGASATALAVALEGEGRAVESSEPDDTCFPLTGRRSSTRPVSVAITEAG